MNDRFTGFDLASGFATALAGSVFHNARTWMRGPCADRDCPQSVEHAHVVRMSDDQ